MPSPKRIKDEPISDSDDHSPRDRRASHNRRGDRRSRSPRRSPRRSRSPKRSRSPRRRRNDSKSPRRSRSPSRQNRNRSRSPVRRRDDKADRYSRGKVDRDRRSKSPYRNRNSSRSPRRNRDDRAPRRDRSRSKERRRDDKSKWDRDESPRRIKRELESPSKDDGKKYGLERRNKNFGGDNKNEKEKWGKPENWATEKKEEPVVEKEKVNMGTSGKLAEDTNMFRGVVIKYNEPSEAKLPSTRWRLYPFKGEEALPALYVHRQSAYLIGRDRKVADIPVDHPSCSSQHAALQYRSMPFERPDGTRGRKVLPYLIDLGSSNGTFLNGNKIDAQRYYELQEKDVIKFGFSSREYVVLNENSAGAASPQSDRSV